MSEAEELEEEVEEGEGFSETKHTTSVSGMTNSLTPALEMIECIPF